MRSRWRWWWAAYIKNGRRLLVRVDKRNGNTFYSFHFWQTVPNQFRTTYRRSFRCQNSSSCCCCCVPVSIKGSRGSGKITAAAAAVNARNSRTSRASWCERNNRSRWKVPVRVEPPGIVPVAPSLTLGRSYRVLYPYVWAGRHDCRRLRVGVRVRVRLSVEDNPPRWCCVVFINPTSGQLQATRCHSPRKARCFAGGRVEIITSIRTRSLRTKWGAGRFLLKAMGGGGVGYDIRYETLRKSNLVGMRSPSGCGKSGGRIQPNTSSTLARRTATRIRCM